MTRKKRPPVSAKMRLIAALLAGVVAAIACIAAGATAFSPLVAWDVTVLVYGCWVWLTVGRMDEKATKSHALNEDPGRAVADIVLLLAAIASIGGVVVLMIDASNASGLTKAADIFVGLISIALSWMMVHTVYTLKYARLYYGRPQGGVNYNEKGLPCYGDFAYLAFTLGMTFQVSDTNLQTKEIRATALRHALLSYVFGTFIIATTINTLASLTS